MHHSFKMSYLEPILVHPVRRQNFGDAVAQTCNPHLIPCHMRRNRHGKHAIPNKGSTWERFLRGPESEHRWALLRHLLTSLCQLFLTILCQHFWRFCVNIFDDSVSTFWTILCQHFWRFYFCREKSRRHRVLWAGNSAGEGVERKTWDNNWKWLIEDDTDFVLDFLRLLPVQSCLNFGGKKLLWVSAYVRNLSGKKNFAWNGTTCAFVNLKENNEFADVTLACEGGQQIEAHKVILAASSSFFQNLGNS